MTIVIILLVVGVGGFVAGRLFLVEQLSPRPTNLGVTDGQLTQCPGSPNCVNSQATSGYAAIEPIPFNGDPTIAKNRILDVIKDMERTTLVEERDDYIYAEFRSAMWGFIDDVEFYVDAEESVIHFRSASRLGRSDLQANRQRMMDIRRRFEG